VSTLFTELLSDGIEVRIKNKMGRIDHSDCGIRPPAQALLQRSFCPGGRTLWLGEIADLKSFNG
jgi:hypothetical protein